MGITAEEVENLKKDVGRVAKMTSEKIANFESYTPIIKDD